MNLMSETKQIIENLGKSISDIEVLNVFGLNGALNIKTTNSEEIEKAIEKDMDISYDDGFGIQYIHGIILFKDGTWIERVEYDGAEWWEPHEPVTKEIALKWN